MSNDYLPLFLNQPPQPPNNPPMENTPPTNARSSDPPQETSIVTATPFDEQAVKDFALSAIGAGAITLVVAAGSIFIVAGSLKMITWILGGIAGILLAIAPWAAVLLGICAYSAYSK